MECTLYLAEGCNLKCSYCYEGITKKNGIMGKETVEQTLEYITKNALDGEKIHLLLLGGEPLLNKQAFFYVINIINTKYQDIRERFSLEMTTNGTLLDDKIMKIVKDEKINLSVSIDGQKETHEINRKSINGKENFSVILKNIYKMLELEIPFNVRMTVSNNTVQYLYQNVVFFFEMGIERVYVSYDYYAKWTDEELIILDEQMKMLDIFYLNEVAYTDNRVLNLYDFRYTTFLAKRPIVFCSAGSIGHFVVDSNGKIFPCGYVANEEIWEIGDVYNGIDERRFRSCVKQHVVSAFSCKSCEIAFACLATRCGFLNFKRTGLLNYPAERTCKLEKNLYIHNLQVFQELYRRKCPRIMKYINIAIEYRLEPNECVKNMFE